MKKKVLAAVLIAMTMLVGCGSNNADESTEATGPIILEEETIPSSSETEESSVEEEPEEPEISVIEEREIVNGKMQSYLTGEWKDAEVVQRRNMAVMQPNNQRAGYGESSPLLHQYGISKASIIYEAPVEGRITRLMCLYEDYDDLEKIGPIRSSRDYYIYEAMAYDSIYVNWGLARPWVEELINSDRIDNISASVAGIYNGYDAAFFRDTTVFPGSASEFTGFLNVKKYADGVKARGYETEYRDTFEQAFTFANDCVATYDDYPEATKIWPGGKSDNAGGYGNYAENNIMFEYNKDDQLYYRYQYGAPHIDCMNDEQVAVTNVVFKICHGEERLPDDPNYDYLAFGVHGTGDAVIFTNGKVIEGTWSRESDTAANKFYDADGNEIVMNQGKTWICCIWKEFSEYMLWQ